MKLRIKRIGRGLHAREVVIEVETDAGGEKLAVDSEHLEGDALRVGWPVGTNATHYLVELPNETFRGQWRVWVRKQDLNIDDERAVA